MKISLQKYEFPIINNNNNNSLTRLNLHPNTYTQLQKSAILGTCSIVRNFLNYR